jgi:serine/threonine protein phosphatase 1
MRVYAFTDVHGRYDLLKQAFDWIDADCGGKAAHIFGLGDYIDRGPDSARVVELLSAGPANPNHTWTLLQGNHDRLMVESSAGDPLALETWLRNEGIATLGSYGLAEDEHRKLPKSHVDFLSRLPLWAEDEHRYYVHAGFRPGIAIEDQSEHDMLWIRDEFLDSKHDFGKPVVHGHSINMAGPEVTPLRINLDTGACFDGGRLTVAAWDDDPARLRFESFACADGIS